MTILAWNWLKKNVILTLLLAATVCLALALDEVIKGAMWSLSSEAKSSGGQLQNM